MGKVLPKKKSFRSKIYSPKLALGSHIDNVRHSLEYLIFSNEKETESILLKKRIKVVVVVTVLFMIVGSYLSPKGKAEVATFYPTACLGGWVNPRNAEGEPETKSNTDQTQFNKENSALLPATTQADMYCGNFVGQIEQNTKPTKIIVTMAWSKGEEAVLEKKIISDSFASSSGVILDTASTTNISFTLSSSTEDVSTATSSVKDTMATSTTMSTTTIVEPSQETSVINQVIDTVGDAFGKLFGVSTNEASTTSSVSIPAPVPTPASITPETTQTPLPQTTPSPEVVPVSEPAPDIPPVSLLQTIKKNFASHFAQKVFAEVVATTSNNQLQLETTTDTTTTTPQTISSQIDTQTAMIDASSTVNASSSLSIASTTDGTSTPSLLDQALGIVVDSNAEDSAPNNFLEILYTFDGVTWKSMGKVNEDSMKYRTFEIPITATTSWNDLGQLQIKVQLLSRIDATPAVYFDGIKMEVLYETPVIHEHPDFARDTILKDKSDDGVRILNIINGDTNANELWYTTIQDQAEYGVAPGSWVQVTSDQTSFPYRLIDIYGQNIFLLDDAQKLLWVKNLKKETNDGIGLVVDGTTTAPFTKSNGEEWLFEYNYETKDAIVRIKG